MGDHQGPGSLLDVDDRRKRHLAVGRRRRRRQIDARQSGERLLQRRIKFEDDAILVRLRIDGRDDALAEGIVKRVVDGGRRDAETAGGGAVDDKIDRQPLLLQIAGDAGHLRQPVEASHQLRHPGGEFGRIGVFEHEIVRRAIDRRIDGQVLHRLHVERNAAHAGHFALQPLDDRAGAQLALVVAA